MISERIAPRELVPHFHDRAAPDPLKLKRPKTGRKPTKVLSIRLTDTERAHLETLAGDHSLSTYARERLLGNHHKTRRQKQRRVAADEVALAQILATLGQSRLSQNLNQMAHASNAGTLRVKPKIQQELLAACAAVQEMRTILVEALR